MPLTGTPISFLNHEGHRLFGVLHQPDQPSKSRPAILLLSPGVKMRVAPHRLYLKMAERFVALGHPVLRFDFHGLGDAEGRVSEPLLADLYGATQVGRYVGDTIAAMDWMQSSAGTREFIAAGLCGGALTGLLTAKHDQRIRALLGLSIPVILDGSNIDASKYMTDAQLRGTRRRYLAKLRLWDRAVWRSWLRLLSLQSHYSLIFKALSKPILSRLYPAPAKATTDAKPTDNTNPHFTPALIAMLSTSRPVFLAFAETDRLLPDFTVKCAERHRAQLDRYPGGLQLHVTKQANHIFSLREWQEDVLDSACLWLSATIPGSQTRAASAASVAVL